MGGTGSRKGGFVKQRIRDEDRVNVKIDVAVSYRFVAKGDAERFPAAYRGKLLDISMSGAQVEGPIAAEVSRSELNRGTVTVEAAFDLPFADRPLETAARVNWIKPSSHPRSYMGFKFLNTTDADRRIIRAFLIGLQSPARKKLRGGR